MTLRRWAALPLVALFFLADARVASSRCIVGGTCGDPPPPHGSGSSSGGSSGPPAPDPQVAPCMDVSAGPPPSSCQPVLAAEIARRRQYGVTPTRPMFHPDTVNGYPDNMATTTSANLLSHPGAASNAAPQANQLTTSTELTYLSLLVSDWARSKGGSLVPDYSDDGAWAPHALHGDPTVVSSCQEWTYRKWWTPAGGVSGVLDGLAACGSNGACRVDAAFYAPGSPFFSGAPAATVPATPARTATTVPIAYRQNAAIPKNPFYQVSGQLFEAQEAAIRTAVLDDTAGCTQDLQGPFTPAPNPTGIDFVPTRYSGANAAGKVSTLMGLMFAPPVYAVGCASTGSSPIVGRYNDEKDMIVDLWQRRTLPGVPTGTAAAYAQDDPFEVAIRERIAHLRELLALYATLTHFTCADTASLAGGSSSGGGSGGGTGSGGGGGGSGSSSGGKPKPVMENLIPTDLDARIAAATEVQDEIVSFMLDEYDRGDGGCFGSNQTACDVDPFEVTERVGSSFDAAMEDDFRTCVAWTGSNFGTLTVGGVDALIEQRMAAARARLLNAPGIDPAADASTQSPVAIQTAQQATQAPVERDAIGQVVTGSRYMGDPDLAGGGYSYGAYWKVTPADFVGPPSNGAPVACELDGAVHGELHGRIDLLKSLADPVCSPVDQQIDALASRGLGFADPAVTQALGQLSSVASAFGFPDVVSLCQARYRMRHLADAYLTAKAVPNHVSYDGEVFFGGTQMWPPQGAVGATPNITASWPAAPVEVQGPEMTIVVVVVPVTFDLYGEIQYGAEGFARAGSIASCGNPSLEAHVGFTPWVTVDAIGSVGVGFSFAQAGVRGKIRVLDARLPLDAFVAVAPDPTTGALELQAGAHASLDLKMMDGSLSAFAELNLGVVDEEAEAQLASWSGLHTTVPILDWDLQPIPLPTFDQNTWNEFQTTTQQE